MPAYTGLNGRPIPPGAKRRRHITSALFKTPLLLVPAIFMMILLYYSMRSGRGHRRGLPVPFYDSQETTTSLDDWKKDRSSSGIPGLPPMSDEGRSVIIVPCTASGSINSKLDGQQQVTTEVQFYRTRCQPVVVGKNDERTVKEKGGCSDDVRPIVSIIPEGSEKLYFPKEVLLEEMEEEEQGPQDTVGRFPQRMEKVLSEDGTNGFWLSTSSSGPPIMRCASRALVEPFFSAPLNPQPNWIWGSSGFVVSVLLYTIARDVGKGVVEGSFTFRSREKIHFYGLPLRKKPSAGWIEADDDELDDEAVTGGTLPSGTVPLVYAFGERSVVGILWLNGSPSHAYTTDTADSKPSGMREQTVHFASATGATRVFLLPGPTLEDVLLQYYTLTGFPVFPPLFALGYHHHSVRYRHADDILHVNHMSLSLHLPIDTVGMNLGAVAADDIFAWPRRRIADSLEVQTRLWRDGGHIIVLAVTPTVVPSSGSAAYIEGKEKGYFIFSPLKEGAAFVHLVSGIAKVWIDFLNPRARQWYSEMMEFTRFVGSTNLTHFSLVDNEPMLPRVLGGTDGVTLPSSALHYRGVRHRQARNVYGMLHSMAAYDGQLSRTNNEYRPFVVTQSYFAGSQRYAAVRLRYRHRRNNDLTLSWARLRETVELCILHSISGLPFVGPDINVPVPNSFWGKKNFDELQVRWYQLSAFLPLFRSDMDVRPRHATILEFPKRTIFRIREAVLFRYTLLPYYYTLFWRSHLYGEPILRPVFLPYEKRGPPPEKGVAMSKESFFVGPDLFVAPVLSAVGEETAWRKEPHHRIRLPPNDLYYDYWTGALQYQGGLVKEPACIRFDKNPPFAEAKHVAPLFLRVGSILPTFTQTRTMRSSHDPANYTLTIALPQLTSELLWASEPVNSSDGRLLAEGELFVDGGDNYVDYNNHSTIRSDFCALRLECRLFPHSYRMEVRLKATVNSSCGKAVEALKANLVELDDPNVYVIDRLRLLFASPSESRFLVRGLPAASENGRQEQMQWKVSYGEIDDNVVEVHNFFVQLSDSLSNENTTHVIAALDLRL
ncbi:glycosyl hydrolase-like protein, putative [Trypanosoma brucei gambiense DAL972]|uniref:Glycosyl hydrolase-like protein, putative n=1 Tax=Trypanosoma brucei gambiense (strain MHOM/CI/86/DAL972) TaxID=679716 RepID=D0A8P3_TRYB9|nr:glycosyl hydrolase-like protein, putative [Trypanosoma brucei gambiense DAL972]CBH18044.1 glycosyl hydrolase-like protein, putative [Trypanosoma brucei gambiense DAL972]|eukprot:XP_011780308.1 glycosyl hydrolase-like protein, putative [Trypanosoma brucei gambiense DAL972]